MKEFLKYVLTSNHSFQCYILLSPNSISPQIKKYQCLYKILTLAPSKAYSHGDQRNVNISILRALGYYHNLIVRPLPGTTTVIAIVLSLALLCISHWLFMQAKKKSQQSLCCYFHGHFNHKHFQFPEYLKAIYAQIYFSLLTILCNQNQVL